MREAVLDCETDFEGFRRWASAGIACGLTPDQIVWRTRAAAADLLAGAPLPDPKETITAPKSYGALARRVILHSDPARFALLYRLLWRIKREEPRLLQIAADADTARARDMEKSVRRDMHKMKAFVRFRRTSNIKAEHYAAWFEPAHYIEEAIGGFFARRFPNMIWSILTPRVSTHWDGEALSFSQGVGREAAPQDDDLEEFWRTYYAAIFNPARLKPDAMRAEMPVKYWKNLPEARLIRPLMQEARKRETAMIAAEPGVPPARKGRVEFNRDLFVEGRGGDPADALAGLAREEQGCRNCPLYQGATQVVPGEGPADAELMFVGEQPGDQEDLQGRPFIGPAGQMFDKGLAEAGIARCSVFVTNAVKHFKYETRGPRRLHMTPSAGEVKACKIWLDREIGLVRPKRIVALGATAAKALLGPDARVTMDRSRWFEGEESKTLITVHPSFLMRVKPEEKEREFEKFVTDLKTAAA